jgi:hypothetical protein
MGGACQYALTVIGALFGATDLDAAICEFHVSTS